VILKVPTLLLQLPLLHLLLLLQVERIEALLPAGLNARSLIAKQPRLLSSDVEEALPVRLQLLSELLAHLPTTQGLDLAAVINRCPQLLTYRTVTLAAKIEALSAALPLETVGALLVRYCTVIVLACWRLCVIL
jgi:hypothetical protein